MLMNVESHFYLSTFSSSRFTAIKEWLYAYSVSHIEHSYDTRISVGKQ